MTYSDPTPSGKDPLDEELALMAGDPDDPYREWHEDDELLEAAYQDDMIKALGKKSFPIIGDIVDARKNIGESSGLHTLYFRLAHLLHEMEEFNADGEKSSEYSETCTMLYAVEAITKLADTKQFQDDQFGGAEKALLSGDASRSEALSESAIKAYNDIEADLLSDDQLDRGLAEQILKAAESEFTGISLLPLTPKSEEYIAIYRLNKDRDDDYVNAYSIFSKNLSLVIHKAFEAEYTQHPDFNEFADRLSRLVSGQVLDLKYKVGFDISAIYEHLESESQKTGGIHEMAANIGIDPALFQQIYESLFIVMSNDLKKDH